MAALWFDALRSSTLDYVNLLRTWPEQVNEVNASKAFACSPPRSERRIILSERKRVEGFSPHFLYSIRLQIEHY